MELYGYKYSTYTAKGTNVCLRNPVYSDLYDTLALYFHSTYIAE